MQREDQDAINQKFNQLQQLLHELVREREQLIQQCEQLEQEREQLRQHYARALNKVDALIARIGTLEPPA